MLHRWLCTLLSLICCSSVFADTFVIKVKVVDANKEPVANADVSMYWHVKDGVMTPMAELATVSDADGKAVLRVDDWHSERSLLVLTADRALGGIASVNKADDRKEITVTLGPTLRVKGEVRCKELSVPSYTITKVSVDGFRAQFADTSNPFQFVLPAGKYTLTSRGLDVEEARQTVTVVPGRSRFQDLGTLDMKATPIGKLKGKTPPDWLIADARGAKPGVKLSDYKGKWVYIEFWGYL